MQEVALRLWRRCRPRRWSFTEAVGRNKAKPLQPATTASSARIICSTGVDWPNSDPLGTYPQARHRPRVLHGQGPRCGGKVFLEELDLGEFGGKARSLQPGDTGAWNICEIFSLAGISDEDSDR